MFIEILKSNSKSDKKRNIKIAILKELSKYFRNKKYNNQNYKLNG